MRTYIIAVLLALACFSFPRPALAEQSSFAQDHPQFVARTKLVRSYDISVVELMALPEGRSHTAQRYFRETLLAPHTKPRLIIVIVPGRHSRPPYVALGGDIDDKILQSVNHDLSRALTARRGDLEFLLIVALGKLSIELPNTAPKEAPSMSSAPMPVMAIPPPPIPPPKALRPSAERSVAPTVSHRPYLIAIGILAVITILCAFTAFWIGRRSGRKHVTMQPAAHLSDDELLKKWGFSAEDFDYKPYEQNVRNKLHVLGMKLHFLISLVEVAAEKYPVIYDRVRTRLYKASRYLAHEMMLRHLDVTIHASSRKDQIVELCRGLELFSDPIRMLAEAYEGELSEHFACFATIRENHSDLTSYRGRIGSSEGQTVLTGAPAALARYDQLCADIKSGAISDWAAAHLELTVIKTELDALFKTDGVPIVLSQHDRPTKRLSSLTARLAQAQSLSVMRTAVPQGESDNNSKVIVLVGAAQAP